jgi:cytochrome o ubiquinol oxidase subunit III
MSKSLVIHHQDTLEAHPDTRVPDPHQDTFSKNTLGFWIYLMTDCLVFATLFITFAVMRSETFGGPSTRELFRLSTPFAETMILLFSSVTCGMGVLSSLRGEKNKVKNRVIGWLVLSFILGASFIALELSEFSHLAREGNSWERSAALSSFFTLVGTHGLHVSCGLLWMIVIMAQVFVLGITAITFRRLVIFSLFWHFLDVVWIFIFTFVYLLGVI